LKKDVLEILQIRVLQEFHDTRHENVGKKLRNIVTDFPLVRRKIIKNTLLQTF